MRSHFSPVLFAQILRAGRGVIAPFQLLPILALLFTGCAATGPIFKPVTDVPPDHGTLYLYRPGAMVGAAVAIPLQVDETPVGKMSNAGYLVHTLPPGLHVIRLTPFKGFMVQNPQSAPLDINIEPAKSCYVRVSWSLTMIGSAGEVAFQEIEERLALPEIETLRLSVTATKQ